MIYARFGNEVTSIRYATLAECKKAMPRMTKQEKECFAAGSYVFIEGPEVPPHVSHQAYLRATDGLREIMQALGEREEVEA